jgi:uncharacterized protein (UPF0276 family)
MSYRARHAIPDLGVGVGFRAVHRARVLEDRPAMDWFEVISENFMVAGGRVLDDLARLRSAYAVVPHGVSLAIGSVSPLDDGYLSQLRVLVDRLDPPWVSDHLCWGSVGGRYAHDLLPMPFTEEALRHVIGRVRRVQERLGRQILLENVSSYLTFAHTTIPEWEFLAAVADGADCGILLDVNNVYVSASNHGFAAGAYLRGVPVDRVGQFHLAGHSDRGTHLLDTHDGPVCAAVWELYREAVARFGRVSTLVEWDEHVPEFDVLRAEAERARALEASVGLPYAESA